MKTFLSLIALCVMLINPPTENDKIKIPENTKLQATFSSKLDQSSSFHQAILKNKDDGNFDFMNFKVDADGGVTSLSSFSFKDKAECISVHTAVDGTVVQTFYAKDKLKVIAFNQDNIIAQNEIAVADKPLSIFKNNGSTIMLGYNRKTKEIDQTIIGASGGIEVNSIPIDKKNEKKYKKMINGGLEVVDLEDYSKYGSIKESQAYLINGNILIVHQTDDDSKNIELITITNDGKLSSSDLNIDVVDEVRNTNSFVRDGKLFHVSNSKEDMKVNIMDLKSRQRLKSVSLDQDLRSLIKDSDRLDKLLKMAKRGSNAPTVTANQLKNGNVEISLSAVNKNTYQYYNYWWWHHHWMMQNQMMLMQQQNMIRSMNGFGPSGSDEFIYTIKKDLEPIKFVIDKNLNLQQHDESQETTFTYVDKQEVNEDLKKKKEVKKHSTAFLNSKVNFIHTDKKKEYIFLKTQEVD
ncbi:hypothetical protein BST97_11565 [Nonlabens spongiae]|uniref:Uncharacterized protein n=1 Tax=Nonlabens spongiae TaxID=331648 RepID=A0A1W6MLV4_9FLAO|nr:hypothetical protein [Nonlabens spongiae]ARN78573.1 hypothetical protein BST97_11565 [Nonlabens spongiae]